MKWKSFKYLKEVLTSLTKAKLQSGLMSGLHATRTVHFLNLTQYFFVAIHDIGIKSQIHQIVAIYFHGHFMRKMPS